ncbi:MULTISPECIES: inositol monophosphatase family protein [unclassified Synechocystis]|uniref:inositol monophosphatase family protein n=1 Tax=unclassified Synechocystis TaxID=2640012 RepID=UPI0003F760C2|nr:MULTISPECIES: inositol monophosphatase family protein [unclassified Synechocystis]AIE72929.1 Histidinol-phosphatase [alternative form] [Synechocystis sp. PCC 6714]MCT0252594.1 inositol monophosphatase family protein [Synechocystis sp. CS-94]
METFWPEVLGFCQSATKAIATELVAQSAKIPAQRKADGSLVTAADQWSDRELRQRIAAQFPDHGVLTEETAHIFPANDWCWIVDPIDGTTNFTRGIPIWGISLGLLYRGTPVFGFLHFPLLNQSFWGYWLKNSGLTGPHGAFLNGEPIQVSDAEPSQNHLFNLCARSSALLTNPFPCKLRLIGVSSYNIALVALGAALGGTEKTPKIWDIAGAWPILLAAGGEFLCLRPEPLFPLIPGQDYGDRPYPCITASCGELMQQFKGLVLAVG